MKCTRWMGVVVCPAVLVMSAGLLGGWSGVQPQPGSGQQPPLSGPPVQDRNVPGVNGQFGDGAGRDRKAGMEPEIPHRVYMKAIMDAVGEGAGAAVKASPEQMEKIRAIDQDYNDSVRKYMEENRGQMEGARRLLEQRGKGKGKGPGLKGPEAPGGPDAEADPMETPEQAKQREEMMEKARQFREKMPKAGDAHTKMWEVLNEAQRKAVQVELDKFKEQQKQQREEAYVRQKVNKKSPVGKPGEVDGQPQPPGKRPLNGAAPGGDNGGGAAMTPERRERLMKLFERLSPEQQDEVLKRLEERLNGGAGKGRAGNTPPPPK